MWRWLVGALAALLVAAGVYAFLNPLASALALQNVLMQLSGARSEFAQVDGNKVHYIDMGSGPPLILLHGHPSRAIEWSPLLPSLARGRRVIAVDFLGYGESDAPADSDFSIATQSRMIVRLMDELGIPQADIMGFSMGGWVALNIAATEPTRVNRLLLVDSGGLRFTPPVDAESYVPADLAAYRRLERLQTNGEGLPDNVARAIIRQQQDRAWIMRRVGASLFSMEAALDGQLQAVTMPTLIVWGEDDRLIPLAIGERLHASIPQSQFVSVAGCSHLVLWECTNQVLPPILEFLAEPQTRN